MIEKLTWLMLSAQIWSDTCAQDLVEYALMAGFVAVSAGALMPGIASEISIIFSKIGITASKAATQS